MIISIKRKKTQTGKVIEGVILLVSGRFFSFRYFTKKQKSNMYPLLDITKIVWLFFGPLRVWMDYFHVKLWFIRPRRCRCCCDAKKTLPRPANEILMAWLWEVCMLNQPLPTNKQHHGYSTTTTESVLELWTLRIAGILWRCLLTLGCSEVDQCQHGANRMQCAT